MFAPSTRGKPVTTMKVTRRGSLRTAVKEVYLRDDIPCSIRECDSCFGETNRRHGEVAKTLSLSSSPEYMLPYLLVIPTSRVVCEKSDWLFDAPRIQGFSIGNVIITFTTLLEIDQKWIGHSLNNPRNVKEKLISRCTERVEASDAIEVNTTQFSLFPDVFFASIEHHRPSSVSSQEKGPINESIARIFGVADWYDRHLFVTDDEMADNSRLNGRVLLLCADVSEKDKLVDYLRASHGGVDIMTCEQLISKLNRTHTICGDHHTSNGDVSNVSPLFSFEEKDIGDEYYRKHLQLECVQEGLRNGTMFQGVLRCSVGTWCVGFVSRINAPDVIVRGTKSINRALDGDTVIVELCPEQQKEQCEKDFLSAFELDKDTEVPDTDSDKLVHGKVVLIVKRIPREMVGSIRKITDQEMKYSDSSNQRTFVPTNPRFPEIRLTTRFPEALENQRITVMIDNWPHHSRLPRGHWVKTLGQVGDRDTEAKVILHDYDVITNEFQRDVIECLPHRDFKADRHELKTRLDMRGIVTCTVDPPGCKDIDDALSCEVLKDGSWRIGVHIADVSYFVKPDTAIDLEASRRSTTVYLVDRRTDMLPGLLTTDLCSLVANEDRLCFSVLWIIDPVSMSIRSTRFCRGIINSLASLSYAEAHGMILNDNDQSDVTQTLRRLSEFARFLKEQKNNRGGLQLASEQMKFDLDPDTFDPCRIGEYVLRETNSMVEELMLLANISVAKEIKENFPSLAIIRRHPPPDNSKLHSLKALLDSAGMEGFDCTSNLTIAESLASETFNRDDHHFNKIIRILTTRTMNQAEYVRAGEYNLSEIEHYGLATEIYTHFTSPIRRYADILVHRLLSACISPDLDGVYSIERFQNYIGSSISHDSPKYSTFRTTPPNLLNCLGGALSTKEAASNQCYVMNKKHIAARYAARASEEFFTYLFFKRSGPVQCDALVTAVRKDASLQLSIPFYGISGICCLNSPSREDKSNSECIWTPDLEKNCVSGIPEGIYITIRIFDYITIHIDVDENNARLRPRYSFIRTGSFSSLPVKKKARHVSILS